MRVLVVDDSEAWRDAICTMVAATPGFEIVGVASSGIEALGLFVVLARPQLVLLDVQMPALSGIETARRLRDQYPDVLVVLLTANKRTSPGDASIAIEDKLDVSPRWLEDVWRRYGESR